MKYSIFTLLSLSTLSLMASEQSEALNYLNTLRQGAGMSAMTLNQTLNTAAQNHVEYLLSNNTFGHGETSGNPDYTADSPSDRGTFAGYNFSRYGENIAAGASDSNQSIDQLFTAIYHRLGFLDFDKKELGVGFIYDNGYTYDSAHVFNMATDINTNPDTIIAQNPPIVTWPYAGYTQMQPAFFNNESPAPLPECSQNGPSGNPISVQFNPQTPGTITPHSFTLKDSTGNTINAKLLDQNNNPILNDKEFILFPIERLAWDTHYTTTFLYNIDGQKKELTWSFKTKVPKYPLLQLDDTATTYDVAKNSTYAFYLQPDDCHDTKTYYSSYNPAILETVGSQIDANTRAVKVIGDTGNTTTLQIGNGKSFNLHIFTEELTNLTFSDITSHEVTLNWAHNDSGEETGYKIFRDGTLIAIVAPDISSYHDKGLTPLSDYQYTVKVTNDAPPPREEEMEM